MFGERLKELRRNNKLTQQELANKLKVSASTVGMYEQGRRSPDTGTLNQVAEYFDVSVDWLLGRTYIPNNKLIEKYLDIIVCQIEAMVSESEEIPFEGSGTSSDSLTDLSKVEKIAAIHSMLKDIKEVNGDLELEFYVHDTPSTDKYLTGNSNIKNPYNNDILTKKDDNDISTSLEEMKKRLMTSDSLMFDGQPATPDQVQAILNAIEMGEAYAKQRAKEKFTPKKYRK